MACLRIRLLGPFHVTLDGEPVTEFESDSVRALLAYLACAPGSPRSRAVIAEMLWPERPEGAALSNLRHALTVIRHALGGTDTAGRFLITDRNTVSVAASPEVWVDLIEFEEAATFPAEREGAVAVWANAAALCRGPLLDGLHVRAGAEWEEWVVVTSERIRRQLAGMLQRLADHHERSGDWPSAIPVVRRLTEVEPWDERAHRQLMRLLAHTGDTAKALASFQRLQDRLEAEFGTAPSTETAALAEQLRAGGDSPAGVEVEIAYPAFLRETRSAATPTPFVGRERELAFLDGQFEEALRGRGRVALIAGEAGTGKTMLAAALMRRATEATDVLEAWGRCNAYGGLGDPYLPFREALALLSGDIESSLRSGAVDREQATRLWEAVPLTSRMIHERGRSLIGIMIGGQPLLDRVGQAVPGAPWLAGLRTHVEAAAQRPPVPGFEQPALFDEYAAVLEGIAAIHPLLVVIDDLQWADRGSIALLWHLARRLEGRRVLVVGMYRPEDITGTGDGSHPLHPVLQELRATTQDSTLELAGDRGFIDALIDAEPNDLDDAFRNRLFAYTNGHPLYTVEMVRGMRDRAEIRRNQAGVWTAQESLDWDRLPTQLQAAIGQRLARLPEDLRNDLTIAAVQGEEFVAETVATVKDDPDAPARLSREGASTERLIEPAGVRRIDGRLASRYRFRHVLFQRYLYDRLDDAEMFRLHEATGRALEALYEDHPEPAVVDLAYHFERAGLADPAVGYLSEAGKRAIRMRANEEAIGLVERAHELLLTLPASRDRDERELHLLVSLAAAVMAVRGYASPEGERIGSRVRELCDRVGPLPIAVMALIGMAQVMSIGASYRAAAVACREALAIAEQLDDQALQVLANFQLGYCMMWAGDLVASHRHLEEAHRLHDPERHSWLGYAFGVEPGAEALVWDAANTLMRGDPATAIALGDASVALARRLDHPFTLCHVLAVESVIRMMRREYDSALTLIDELGRIATAEHFPYWTAAADVYRGWALGHGGAAVDGAALMRRGLDAWRAAGARCHLGFFSCVLAELEHLQGNPQRGLEVVDDALAEVAETDERLSEVHLHVQRGRLLRLLGDERAAGTLEAALDASRAIGARLQELRAATDLALVLEGADRSEDARMLLTPLVEGSTEHAGNPDLQSARRVLEFL